MSLSNPELLMIIYSPCGALGLARVEWFALGCILDSTRSDFHLPVLLLAIC